MSVYFVELDFTEGGQPPQLAVPTADRNVIYTEPYGGGGAYNAQTVNKAWHTPTSQWVYWKTDSPDPAGVFYPGPGTFGETTNYSVDSIVYVAV